MSSMASNEAVLCILFNTGHEAIPGMPASEPRADQIPPLAAYDWRRVPGIGRS